VRRGLLRLGLVLALMAPPAVAQGGGESLQAFLMTMGPGASIYERFGHNAIWIRDTTTGLDLVYNYGTFDFDEPGFVGRFVFGRPRYWLAVGSLDTTLRTYAYFQRDVVVQELALPAGKKAELAIRLAENLLPENRTYTYDYYLDNCSTRVRDMLDVILGGALRRATEGTPGEGTLRFHTQRSVSHDPAMYLGILAAMGPRTDAPLDQWGEMFLPAKVQERVRELTVPDGMGGAVPLVIREDTLLRVGVHAVEPTRADWSGRLLLVGLLISVVSATGVRRGGAGVPGRVAATLWLVTSGIAGLVLLFLWFGTDHVATRGNWNVALLNPLGLLLVPMLWRRSATRGLGRWEVAIGTGYALSLLAGLVAVWAGAQSTGEILALAFLPGLVAHSVAVVLSLRPAPAQPTPH
jgi:hypothetical protein